MLINREIIQQQRDLLLSALAVEDDTPAIEAGVEKLADLNAKLKRLDELQVARNQIREARRIAHENSQKRASSDQQIFADNCRVITAKIMAKVGIVPEVHGSPDNPNAKRWSKTFARVIDGLTFDAAQKQTDEILTAAREHRDWQEVVTLPKAAGEHREVVNRFGEYVTEEVG
jgi:hypothetical protein